jgi:PleD family two-component response regulator
VAEAVSGEDFDETVARSDEALHLAKEGGRNRVIAWTAPPPAHPDRRAPVAVR